MIYMIVALLILFAILVAQDFFLGVLLVIGLLPSYLIRFIVAGIPTTLLECMVLILIAMWLIRRVPPLLAKKRVGVRSALATSKRLIIPITLFFLAATISIFISPDKHAALGSFKALYLEPILFFFLLVDTLRGQIDSNAKRGLGTPPITMGITRIFRALGASAIAVSLFGIVQWIFDIGIPSPWDLERRITSVFDYPNALALFLEPIIVISWFEIRKATKGAEGSEGAKGLVFWILVSILSTINVFLAQSEAGLAALVITAVCILLFSKNTRQQTIIATLIISALIFTIPVTRSYLVEKFTFSDSSEHVRLSQWKETVALLHDHPLFGAGLSGYPILMKKYHHDLQYEIFQYPHNVLLNIWVELGLLGLLAFALLAFQILRMTFLEQQAAPSKTSPPSNLPTFFLPFIFFEMTVHGLVDVPYFKNDLAMMTWIFLALFMVLYVHPTSSQTETNNRA